jgi:hypothetical protein
MLAAVDQQNIFCRQTTAGERSQALFHVVGQGRSANVEAQLDRGGNLVHVLAAGARCAHKTFLDVAIVELDPIGDSSHFSNHTCMAPFRSWAKQAVIGRI